MSPCFLYAITKKVAQVSNVLGGVNRHRSAYNLHDKSSQQELA